MVYAFVLIVSFAGICLILSLRVLMRNRSVRKFVRSVRHRTDEAHLRGAMTQETPVEKPQRNMRKSAVELQEVRTLVNQADKLFAQKKFDEAEKVYIQALTVMPDSGDVHAHLAKFYLDTDRPQKAEAMYVELLRKHDDASYHANLGLAYYQQEKYKQATESYKAAFERDEKNPERMAAYGKACVAAAQYENAVELLTKACNSRLARDTELLYLLAESHVQLGHIDQAEDTYRRIHQLKPYDEEVKAKLAELAKV